MMIRDASNDNRKMTGFIFAS